MKQINAVILDWAGTTVDFGSFAPTQIFVEAFKQTFDIDISLAEARIPMGLGKWQHIEALGKLPAVEVGSNIFIIDDLYLSESKRVVSRPLLKNGLVGFDKLLFRKFPLLNR